MKHPYFILNRQLQSLYDTFQEDVPWIPCLWTKAILENQVYPVRIIHKYSLPTRKKTFISMFKRRFNRITFFLPQGVSQMSPQIMIQHVCWGVTTHVLLVGGLVFLYDRKCDKDTHQAWEQDESWESPLTIDLMYL